MSSRRAVDSRNVEFIHSFHEVDEAFAKKFSHITVDGKPVKIFYATPDVDLSKKVELPAIAFYRNPPYRDLDRWNNNFEFLDSPVYDDEGKLVGIGKREFPEPWSVTYKLRIAYDLQEHGVQLNNQLLRAVKRDDYIRIKENNYWIDLVRAKTFGEGGFDSRIFGRIEDGRRRFQDSFDYRVDIWLEIDERKVVKTVNELNIGIKSYSVIDSNFKGGE